MVGRSDRGLPSLGFSSCSARSAEWGRPKFAANELAALAPIEQTPRLLQLKGSGAFGEDAAVELRTFLEWSGLANPLPKAETETDFFPLFVASNNSVGLHLLEHGPDLPSDYV
jgi:hypothetical protein